MLLCFRSLRRCPTSHPPVVPLQRGTEDPPFRIACPRPRRASFALALAVPVVIGGAAGAAVLHLHPSYTENVAAVTQGVMRLLPFLSVTVFFWIAAFPAIRAAIAALSPPYRTAALAAAGYLLAYLILFLGYQAYYGNWLRGGDSTAPIVISDPALVGAALGLFYGLLTWHKARPAPPETDSPAWAVLWLLAFLTLALGAFGHGWFQRFTPQRFMILLGLPLAILAAHGLDAMRPALRRALYTAILACGIISILVASLFFQGSWGRTPGHGPFAYLHYNFMTQADADLLEHLTPGIIAVPMWSPIAFGEIISLRPGARVLGGPGAMNLGDQPFGQIEKAAKTFFSPDTPDVLRRSFARDWCVDYVYWPDTCPLDPRVLEELLATPWLELLAHAGHGAIFRVQKKLLSPGTCEI